MADPAAASEHGAVDFRGGKAGAADGPRRSKWGGGNRRGCSSVRGSGSVGATVGAAAHGGGGRIGGLPGGRGRVAGGGGGASVAVAAVSLLEPAVRNDLDIVKIKVRRKAWSGTERGRKDCGDGASAGMLRREGKT